MSIEVVSWALRVPIGGNAKVVLLGLANHAHADGTESYPALDTLAEYAACDRSTARRNVRKLVEEGWAIEDGLGPKGQTKYRLALDRVPPARGSKTPPVANRDGGAGASEGVAPMPPEPSIEPSHGGTSGARASDDDPRSRVPDDFPAELRPHAREVMRLLCGVAKDHGARRVWPLAVARVVAMHPRHPLVATAAELEAWAVDPPRPIRDVVATYRTFLKRAAELEATERLAPDGTPTSQRPRPLAPVASLNGRRRGNGRPGMARPEDFEHMFEWAEGTKP